MWWTKFLEIALKFLSDFLNRLIDDARKREALKELGRAQEQVSQLVKASNQENAAKEELDKPPLKGNELIDDLRRKNNNSSNNSSKSANTP